MVKLITAFLLACTLTEAAVVSRAKATLPDSGKPKAHKSDSEICEMRFNHGNTDEDEKTWNDSGAKDVLEQFLKVNGVKDWSNNFLTKYAADGEQGGTQYDCTSMWKTTCGPAAECHSYKPVSAFFVHTQMSNLFAAFQMLYSRLVYDAVAAISTDIHEIVKQWGTPPKSQNDEILSGFLSALSSLTGIGSVAESAGVEKGLGPFGAPISVFSAVIGGIQSTESEPADPADLEREIQDAYGQMFKTAVKNINSTVDNIFMGYPKNKREERRASASEIVGIVKGKINDVEASTISSFFDNGKWLDNEITNKAMEIYAKNMENKMVSTMQRSDNC